MLLKRWRALLTTVLLLALLAGQAHCALHECEHHDGQADSPDNCVVCVCARNLAVITVDATPEVVGLAVAEIVPSAPAAIYQSCCLFPLRPRPPPHG